MTKDGRDKPSILPLLMALGTAFAIVVGALFVPAFDCPGYRHPIGLHQNLGMFYDCSDCRDTGKLSALQLWKRSRRVPEIDPSIY